MASKQPIVSYAQNREDLFLYALLGHVKKGFYVDVGANEPEHHSVTKLYYERGWQGINIEPNVELFKKLKKSRPRDINLNIGASDKKSSLSFRLYPHHDGLSTFSDDIKNLHAQSNLPYQDLTVPVDKLSSILGASKVKHIDFMKIDVEGYESEVIAGNDWQKYRPKVVLIEATVAEVWEPILMSNGYIKEFFDGLNNYYIAKEFQSELSIHNYSERILKVATYTKSEIDLQKRILQLESHITELHAQKDVLSHKVQQMSRFRNQVPQLAKSIEIIINTQLQKSFRNAENSTKQDKTS